MALNIPAAGAAAPKTETTIKLPLGFILFGLLAFVASQLILLISSSHLVVGAFRTPVILMAAHLLLLGWLLMTVMGAMYQLIPVAFLTKIWSEKLGFFQFILTAFGILTFSILLGSNIQYAWTGAIPLTAGIILFLFQMIMTLAKVKKKTVMAWFVLTALACLLLTIAAGLWMAWNFFSPSSIPYQFIFHSHLLLGIAGWFSLLIFGFSYKMVPMFSLSHGFANRWAGLSFISYSAGLLTLLFSFANEINFAQTFGFFLLWTGFTLFTLDMQEIIKKRIKKRLDRPFQFSLVAIGNGWIIHGLAAIFSLIQVENNKLWSWMIFLYIFCWIIFSVLGYLFKIVPFLWWTHKYANRVGKEKVPMLKEMVDDKLGHFLFISFFIAILGLAAFSIGNIPAAVKTFQAVLLLCTILYSISILRVLTK